MNKKIILVVVGLVLLGIAGYFVFAKKSTKVLPTPGGNTEQISQPSSLKDLLTKGIAQTCTFSNDTTKGTVSVSAGKVREDFDVTIDGKTTQSHMIVDGTTSYIWTEGQPSGFKMTFNPEASTQPTTSGAASAGGINPNQNMDYSCTPGITNPSIFNLPTGINFMEFTIPSVAPSGQSGSASGSTSAQCAACNNLPAGAKAQCLTALNCE